MQDPFFWIGANIVNDELPAVSQALREPDGLLAAGGDLTPDTLVKAYRRGIFPWYSGDQPILWWSPDPRCVLKPGQIKISRSLTKTLKHKPFKISIDQAFEQVIEACAGPRRGDDGTWLSPEMIRAYIELHALGHAHSVECWHDNELVGGLYGLAIGQVFFGESMFSWMTDASKIALVRLNELLQSWDYQLIDCQIGNPHLSSLGAQLIPRSQFIALVEQYRDTPPHPAAWAPR